jgi:hypothetical protein
MAIKTWQGLIENSNRTLIITMHHPIAKFILQKSSRNFHTFTGILPDSHCNEDEQRLTTKGCLKYQANG